MLGAVVFVALVACGVSHLVLVVSLARRALSPGHGRHPAGWRALVAPALALVIPPLAPYWGWQSGLRWRVVTWWTLVILYAVAVEAAAR